MCIGTQSLPSRRACLLGFSHSAVAFEYEDESSNHHDISNDHVLRCLQERHMSTVVIDYECCRFMQEIKTELEVRVFFFLNQFWNQFMKEQVSLFLSEADSSETEQLEAYNRVRCWTVRTRRNACDIDVFLHDCIVLPVSFYFVSNKNVCQSYILVLFVLFLCCSCFCFFYN